MADSAQSRFSIFEVPGLMMTPIPHGADSAADRSQLDDIYAGIKASPPASSNQTCWIPEKKETQIWVKEKEVVPCDD